MIEVFIFTNGIFLGLLLLIIPSEVRKANVLLALFLISLSLELLPDLFFENEPMLLDTSLFTVPFLFLYVMQVVNNKTSWLQWLILFPSFVLQIFTLSLSIEEYNAWWTGMPFYLFNILLLFFIYRAIREHQAYLLQQYANIDQRALSWITGVIVIFLAFHFIWILEELALWIAIDLWLFAFASEVLTLLVIFWIGYHGLSQQASFYTSPGEEKANTGNFSSDDKVRFESARRLIEERKLYLNQELTLRSLALQIHANEKNLSAWINHFTEDNFYSFINKYRVQEFKRLMNDPANKNLSILGMAQNAGFRNKSTFYKTFKELEGHTPNQFKKESETTN